jgi:hypothetical protein
MLLPTHTDDGPVGAEGAAVTFTVVVVKQPALKE